MAKRLTFKTINEIKKLRSQGWSLPELAKKFKIGHGTAWRHIQGVEILPEYKNIWLYKKKGSIKRKLEAEKEASKKATKTIKNLSKKEKELVLTCLYWGEGGKADFNLTNTDPNLIRIFIKGLQELYNVPLSKIKVNLRLYEDLDKESCINYWSTFAGIPKKNILNINVLQGKKAGKLKYGMCRVRIEKGGNMLKYLSALRKRITQVF